MTEDAAELQSLADELRSGKRELFARLLAEHRPRLRRIVAFRLDPRLRQRVDPSDVLQETYLEATQRLPEALAPTSPPLFVWLRFLALQRVAIAHRRHLAAEGRSVRREATWGEQVDGNTSLLVAAQWADSQTGPSEAVQREERAARLRTVLERLDRADVEVLALRHFEELTHAEVAAILGLTRAGASHRYQRALTRLRDVLADEPGGLEAWQ